MFCGDNPWIIISFAPGSRGFQLGKLLIKNNVAHADLQNINDPGRQKNGIPVNHSFVPAFNDVLMNPKTELQIQLSIKAGTLMNSNHIHSARAEQELYELLELSKNIPHDLNLPNIILTHESKLSGLRTLSQVCNFAKIIRITFDSVQQAKEAIIRKTIIDNKNPGDEIIEQNLVDNYLPFLHNYNYFTNVPCSLLEQNNDEEILNLLK